MRSAATIRLVDGSDSSSLRRGFISFDLPALQEYSAPIVEITGGRPGPRLCVMSGIHIDEVSSIAAALCLEDRISARKLSGMVSIIPIVNTPAKFSHTDKFPQDGKNLHWQFPGKRDGTFSEVLAHALLHEWVGDAAALLDLHGGDIGETQQPFVIFQRTGGARADARHEAMARCFETDFLVGLEPELMKKPGRSCTALARAGRVGLVAERGDNGVLSTSAVKWHTDGVVRVAELLGMLPKRPRKRRPRQLVMPGYAFLTAPCDGLVRFCCKPGARVTQGQVVAEIHDELRRPLADVTAPSDGYLLWFSSMLFAKRRSWIGALGLAPRR
jgi:predicted deacylase